MPVPMASAPKNKPSDYVRYDPDNAPFWQCETDAEAKVQFSETGPASEKACPSRTIIEVMQMAVKKRPNKIAMRTEGIVLKKGEKQPPAKPLAEWKSWTWKAYYADTRKAAKALMALGHEQHDSVAVFGFNSPEWFISQMGAIFAGGKTAGIYPSDNAEQVQFKAFHSNASVAIMENEDCLAKFKEVAEDLPYLKAIVTWASAAGDDITREDGSTIKTMTWEEFLALGAEQPEEELDARIAKVRPGHCCGLIYTSGTTGRPKAVMITHDNLAFESNAVLPMSGIGLKAEEERLISYLPLSHVAGMMVDIISPIVVTAYMKGWMSANFARPTDLKTGLLGQRLAAVEPTIFLGVPRVWEKISEKLKAVGAQTKGLKKKLATNAKKKGLTYQNNQQLGGSGKAPFMYGVYSVLLKAIKKKLGLSKCKFAFTGAAPITRETLVYFGSLGINVNEVYGMSESTGATTWSTDAAHQWGTVGFELSGVEVRCFKVAEDGSKTEVPRAKNILHPTEEEQGEICFRGRHVMLGYLANPKLGEEHVEEIKEKNAGTIDEEGWLHSGDKGAISKQGMIRITGRYKELIIGAGGENIAPVPIEDNIKKLCPYVSNAMMVGDKRKFNVVLLTLKAVGATGELPGTDKLDGEAAAFGKTIEEACGNDKLIKAISKALKDTGDDGDVTPSNAARIRKFTILPIDFSVQTDELTATLKLKRSVVEKKYADLIEAMYESSDEFVPYTVVGSYSGVKGAAGERGSFKASEPLTLVEDDDVKMVQANAVEEEAEEVEA